MRSYTGRQGIIGTNKPDAGQTVERMLADVAASMGASNPDPQAIPELLQSRGIAFVSMKEWRILDQLEIQKGAPQGRPRVKFAYVDVMLQAVQSTKEGAPA